MVNVGRFYENGLGGQNIDLSKAKKYYEAAVQSGEKEGLSYFFGSL